MDIIEEVENYSGIVGGWKFIDGPETGVSVEYWLLHKSGVEAYVVNDQGDISISLSGEE
jgi:hypothetical protein